MNRLYLEVDYFSEKFVQAYAPQQFTEIQSGRGGKPLAGAFRGTNQLPVDKILAT